MQPLAAGHRDLKQLRLWLRDREARAADGVFVAEGPRVVDALARHGVAPVAVYVDERIDPDEVVTGRIDVRAGALDRVADARTSQGVIAVFRRPDPGEVAAAAGEAAWIVVLPRISDPGNLGTIARSAQAAGAGAIVVGPGSVDPYNPKVVRAGAGAVGSLPVWTPHEEAEVRELLDRVVERGGLRLGAAADGPISIDDAPLTSDPLALVFGHETAGLAPVPLDATFAIPMVGDAESINVAMAATVVCFETARRRRVGRR